MIFMLASQSPDDLRIFKALADKARYQALILLASGPKCVCDIYEKLGLKQSIASHHLSILRESGLVEINRDGKWIYYSLNRKKMRELQKSIAKIISTKQNNSKCSKEYV